MAEHRHVAMGCAFLYGACLMPDNGQKEHPDFHPRFRLIPSDSFYFRSWVDCNMAEGWVGDTFRIFPSKYGEDPLWGDANDLKFADGIHADAAFLNPPEAFQRPLLPKIAASGTPGLHGAIWFETIYKDPGDRMGKSLYALYHNENYPSTLPFDTLTGEGYQDISWPVGLGDFSSKASTCRIGLMYSRNGGHSWEDLGIILEDKHPRMIRKPHNNAIAFAGGVGDPSAVASGEYLYIFFS